MLNVMSNAPDIMEALPYMRRFYGKIFVIKCGGAVLHEHHHRMNMIKDIALLHKRGIKVVVVHGGGPDISSMCQKLNMPVQFSNGQRVTDHSTMEIVQMVLSGKMNPDIVSALNQQGVKAVGLSGQDSAFLNVTTHPSLGFVGNINSVNTQLITTLLNENYLPVISPIGIDEKGQAHNINGDIAAGKLAHALSAEKFMILTDTNGIYRDLRDPLSLISVIKVQALKQWLNDDVLSGGIIPKIEAAIDAMEGGVTSTHIISGKIPQGLEIEVFTEKGIGTMITLT